MPGTVIRRLCHNSYFVKTTAREVYQCTRKGLQDRQVNKPDLEPPSADLDISAKALKPVHVPLQQVSGLGFKTGILWDISRLWEPHPGMPVV